MAKPFWTEDEAIEQGCKHAIEHARSIGGSFMGGAASRVSGGYHFRYGISVRDRSQPRSSFKTVFGRLEGPNG